MKVVTNIDSKNKDFLFWAQSQSDLSTLSNENKLRKTGALIRDTITGAFTKIYSLLDLAIGVKYFTENDNIIERISDMEVKLGDRTLFIQTEKSKLETCTGDTPCDYQFETLGETLGNDEYITSDSIQNIPDVSSLLHSKDFPTVTKCTVKGNGYLSSPLEIHYNYLGGVEGNSIIRWEISRGEDQAFTPIKGESSLKYTPTTDDVGTFLRVSYTPVRADGVTGLVVFSNIISIKPHPEILQEIQNNLTIGTLMFKVLLVNGSEFQKRSILLNRDKVKVRKRRCTISKMKYGQDLKVYRDPNNDSSFILEFSKADTHTFLTPTPQQRDIIILTIREFNNTYLNCKVL